MRPGEERGGRLPDSFDLKRTPGLLADRAHPIKLWPGCYGTAGKAVAHL
nr:MAG TPA: hypothetical protein [Caudoviricetes sp.]